MTQDLLAQLCWIASGTGVLGLAGVAVLDWIRDR